MRLQNKIAIITGGGAGMGEAVAKAYAAEGAKVVIAETHVANGQRVRNEIHASGRPWLHHQRGVANRAVRRGSQLYGYSSSKEAVFALTRVMAVDYASDKIRVNALIPGATDTPLTKDLFANTEVRDGLVAGTPLGRLGQPEDVVGMAIFLASDESAFCTGGYYAVDGGLTAV